MNTELIEDALHAYFSKHHYQLNEKLNLNLFYPIKKFQEDTYTTYEYSFCESVVKILPSLKVTSIVVAPKEEI